MQTNQPNRQASIVLRDGGTQLAAWTHSGDQRPTLGGFLDIPARFHPNLTGYELRAIVSRIELEGSLPNQIDLEATCRIKKTERPVVVINSSRIRDSIRGDAETYVRTKLRLPLIYWESGTASYPVVRFYDPATGQKSCPAAIQSGLLDLLRELAS